MKRIGYNALVVFAAINVTSAVAKVVLGYAAHFVK